MTGSRPTMASYHVVYWREIPSMVQARDGTRTVRLGLSPRFQELIDAVAMRDGLASTDQYLLQWRNGPRTDLPGSPDEVARAVAEGLEAAYDALQQRLLSGTGAGSEGG